LVVVTSDHGEEFADHGGFGHNTLHEEIVRVPLFIKWPGGQHAGLSHDAPTSSIDIAPTLLEYAGLEADDLPGSHLRRRPSDQPVITGTLEQAVVGSKFKGVFGRSNGLPSLFDLEVDPFEMENLAEQKPDKLRILEAILAEQNHRARALHRLIGSQESGRDVVLSEQELERLRAFGYIQ
jgi:arylsulfatase A-like enzyme